MQECIGVNPYIDAKNKRPFWGVVFTGRYDRDPFGWFCPWLSMQLSVSRWCTESLSFRFLCSSWVLNDFNFEANELLMANKHIIFAPFTKNNEMMEEENNKKVESKELDEKEKTQEVKVEKEEVSEKELDDVSGGLRYIKRKKCLGKSSF